jgi:hypothetical protein
MPEGLTCQEEEEEEELLPCSSVFLGKLIVSQ